MRSRLFVLLGTVATMLGGPAVAMNTVSASQAPPVAGASGAPAPSCDGCDTSPTATTTQADTAGSSTGPITDPTSGRPAHTEVPTHVQNPPKPPKG